MSLFNRIFSKRDDAPPLETEKGDLLAMFIAALITFGPLVLFISLLYVAIAYLFLA